MRSKTIKGMIQLFRPELSFAAGVCVFAGQILAAGKLPPLWKGVLGFISIFALAGTALILNDTFDYEVDKVNAPQRPLPSGTVTRKESLWLTGFTTLIGLATAGILGLKPLIIGVILWIIGFLYNWRFKQAGLPGNLMVSASVALTFIFGAATVNQSINPVVWIFSLMAFFIDLGEEIAGDAMDMEGDQKRNSKSIALVKGKQFALHISIVMWSMVILLSVLPFLLGWKGLSYLIPILLMDLLVVVFSIRLLKSQTPEAGRKAMRSIYLGATLGLIAFLLSQWLGR